MYGAGDSVKSNIIIYQSNAPTDQRWSSISTDTVESVADGAVWTTTNFNGMVVRIHVTGVSTDTVVVGVEWLQKKDKEISF